MNKKSRAKNLIMMQIIFITLIIITNVLFPSNIVAMIGVLSITLITFLTQIRLDLLYMRKTQ